MTCREFVDNLLNTKQNLDRKMLKSLYDSIKANPYKYGAETQQKQNLINQNRCLKKSCSIRSNDSTMYTNTSINFENHPLRHSLLIINPNEQVDYKHGYVLKKSVYDLDGSRSKFQNFLQILSSFKNFKKHSLFLGFF